MSVITPEEMTVLVRQHVAPLVLYAHQWCDTAEDVVQDALLKLVEQTVCPENVVAWLYVVVRNTAINAGRAARRRKAHEATATRGRSAWFVPTDDQILDGRRAAECLKELPIAQREAVITRLWGRLTFEEIGQISNVSTATASRRYRAGIEALRKELGEPCANTKVPEDLCTETEPDQTSPSR